MLKSFVQLNLETEKAHLKFRDTGRTTTNTNLASIIKMGMELKQMTLQDEANEDGDNSEEESKQDMTVHRNDTQWVQFCN